MLKLLLTLVVAPALVGAATLAAFVVVFAHTAHRVGWPAGLLAGWVAAAAAVALVEPAGIAIAFTVAGTSALLVQPPVASATAPRVGFTT